MATIAIASLIVSATVLTYWPALHGEFIWDDLQYVRDNLLLRSPQGLWQIWFDPMATPQYHPLVFSSFWAEFQLWGLNPLGYHVTNVVLHAANALLLWGVLAALGVPGGPIAAALFALHPVHLESVAWIAERKNTLSGLFCLATVLAWVRYLAPRSRGWYAAGLLLYAGTLLSKSVLCTLPGALLLLAWWKRPSDCWRQIGALVPFGAMSLAIGVLGWWREQLYGNPSLPMSVLERLLVINRGLWFYVGKLVWPAELIPIYPRWDWQVTGWSVALLAATMGVAAALWSLRRRMGKGPLVAAGFFVIMLAPVLGVVDFNYTQYSFVADHFQYMASAGLIAAAAAGAHLALRGRGAIGRTAGAGVIGVLLVALGGLSWEAASRYISPDAFWRHTLTKNPQAWKAHSNLAGTLAKKGLYDEAIAHYAAAIQIRPDFAQAYNHWGVVLTMQGKFNEALEQYRAALRVNPEQADAHNNAGAVLARQGKWDDAEPHFAEAVRINPAYFEAYDAWGIVALRQGKIDEAIAHFETALRLKPDYKPAQEHLDRARQYAAKRAAAADSR